MATAKQRAGLMGAMAAAAGAGWMLRRGRYGGDPAHAPGHRRLGPPPKSSGPTLVDVTATRDQPWIRRSHSDSQSRRFRR